MEKLQNLLPPSGQQLTHSKMHVVNFRDKPFDNQRLLDITGIITEVELVKMITLSVEQKSALAQELYKMGLSIDRLRTQADIVKRSETYGKMALEYWMKDLPVFTVHDLGRFVDKEIERRRELAQASGLNHEQIMAQGLTEVFFELQSQYYDELEKKKEELRLEIKTIAQTVRLLPEKYQRELLKHANAKGYLKEDPHWRETLKFVIPKVLDEARALVVKAKKAGAI